MIEEITATELLSTLVYNNFNNNKNEFIISLESLYKLCNKIQYNFPYLCFDVSDRALNAFKNRNKNISIENNIKVIDINNCLVDIKKGLPTKSIINIIINNYENSRTI